MLVISVSLLISGHYLKKEVKVNHILFMQPVLGESFRRKIKSLRMISFYLAIFTLVFIPMCIMKTYGRVTARLSALPKTQTNNEAVWIATSFGFLFLGITPVTSLYLVSTKFSRFVQSCKLLSCLRLHRWTWNLQFLRSQKQKESTETGAWNMMNLVEMQQLILAPL